MISRYQATYTGAQRYQINPNSPGLPPQILILPGTAGTVYDNMATYGLFYVVPVRPHTAAYDSFSCAAAIVRIAYGRIRFLPLCRRDGPVRPHMAAYDSFPSADVWIHVHVAM